MLKEVKTTIRRALTVALKAAGFHERRGSGLVSFIRTESDRTEVVAGDAFDREGTVTAILTAAIDFAPERALIADRVCLEEFDHRGHPHLCMFTSRDFIYSRLTSAGQIPAFEQRVHDAVPTQVLPWFRRYAQRIAIRRELIRRGRKTEAFHLTLRYPNPGLPTLDNAIAVCIVLGDLKRARTLLERVIDDYVSSDPACAYSNIDPPWWATHLWEKLSWAMRHNVMTEIPPKVQDWFQVCTMANRNLSAALGWFGDQAREQAERDGCYQSPRAFNLKAMLSRDQE